MKNLVIESSDEAVKRQFYYEKREKVHKTRNRMRTETVKMGEFYYEKREKMHKSRNRIYRYNKNKDSLPIYLRSESLFFVC